MTIRNLEHADHAKSASVIGASVNVASAGRVAMNSIVAVGFEGKIFPVNPKYKEVDGRRCFQVSRISQVS